MSNKGAIMRFSTVCICCLAALLYGFCGVVFGISGGEIPQSTEKDNTASAVSSEEKISSEQIKAYTEESESPKPATSSESGSAVAVSQNAAVKGKVIEKFITPYTAGLSYNNVYLKNNTDLPIDLKKLLESPLKFKVEKNSEPQVLIIHTHATESFLREEKDTYTDADLTRTTDNEYNMVKLGNIVADKLNSSGIKTLHSETQHDYPEYNNSYSRAAKTITSTLKQYPSIKIVLDLHRDAIAANDTDKVKLTSVINGKKAAQIMLVMGSQSGSVTNFPNYEENLKLAVRLQQTVEVLYPSLARSISLMPRNYNESLSNGSLLIEIGTDGNTIEEVSYSAELLGNALVNLLNTLG